MRCEMGEADARKTQAKEKHRAQNQECNDGDHLDHRQPVFDGAKIFYAQRVHENKKSGKSGDPDPCGRAGKPELAIDGGGDNFTANNHDKTKPVGIAHGEARPRVQIHFRIQAE